MVPPRIEMKARVNEQQVASVRLQRAFLLDKEDDTIRATGLTLVLDGAVPKSTVLGKTLLIETDLIDQNGLVLSDQATVVPIPSDGPAQDPM